MQTPPAISFHNLPPSPAITGFVHKCIGELEKRSAHIIGCNIVVAALRTQDADHVDFEVRLTIMVPGPDIHVSRHSSMGPDGPDIKLTIRNAFDTARRLLDRRRRPPVRNSAMLLRTFVSGTVDRLSSVEGWGFLIGDDGREFFFERRSLDGCRWESISLGTRLRFREMHGDKGAFASDISLE